MKQLLQNLANGESTLADVPCPSLPAGHLLIQTRTTLVSAGTERMLVDFGRAGWLQKARQQPEKVAQVLDKVRTDGLLPTIEAVRSKLDQPLALGYCNVGVVLEVGAGVTGFAVGDRVASNGRHAEVVAVPANLCARVAADVNDEDAAFTVLAAIALQGLRLVAPTLGESVVVTGLGLIGLVAVQLLRAQGCRVLGLDYDPQRIALAQRLGAETVLLGEANPLAAAERFSRGRGVDAVLITASTKSNEPVHQAAQMCRKRGRIVLVGVTGLELSRADFYDKELSFQVSCSYGPGRYDPAYEEKGQDYPIGFVRWTEQRNFEAVLDLMSSGALNMQQLISHRFDFADAPKAYDLLASGSPSLGLLLRYADSAPEALRAATVQLSADSGIAGAIPAAGLGRAPRLSVLGAGNYAGRVLIPALKQAGALRQTLVSAQGVSASHFGRKFGFRKVATSASEAIVSNDCDALVIATRHDQHAGQVIASLIAGKPVFVEKPLCLSLDELERIEAALSKRATGHPENPILMVGFNRRFAPLVVRAKALLAGIDAPKAVQITINAGAIPADHWTQDPAVGGGRMVGEGCHFIDLARHLIGQPVSGWRCVALQGGSRDSASVILEYADGSIATIHYLANGHRVVPKERVEIYCAGKVLVLDNFRSLRGHGFSSFRRASLWQQDKGQKACAEAFVRALRDGGPSPIPVYEILETSRIAIEVQASMSSGAG